jgi:hypothetical protein
MAILPFAMALFVVFRLFPKFENNSLGVTAVALSLAWALFVCITAWRSSFVSVQFAVLTAMLTLALRTNVCHADCVGMLTNSSSETEIIDKQWHPA